MSIRVIAWPVSGLLDYQSHMGGCQNYGPFLGTLPIRRRIIIGIKKGTIIFDTHADGSNKRGKGKGGTWNEALPERNLQQRSLSP